MPQPRGTGLRGSVASARSAGSLVVALTVD